MEVIAPYLFLSYDYVRRLGPYAVPVAKPQEQIDAYWEHLLRGDIDTIGTDHAPHTRAEKDIGFENIWQTAPGVPNLETYLGLLLTEVNKGRLSIEKLVEVTAENPAKILGFPHKGSLLPGMDADVTVIDLQRGWDVDEDRLETKPKWSPFAGEHMTGRAVMTIVRGRVVMEEGKIVGEGRVGRVSEPAPERLRRNARITEPESVLRHDHRGIRDPIGSSLFLTEDDIRGLGITMQEVIEVVEDVLRQHGNGAVEMAPRAGVYPLAGVVHPGTGRPRPRPVRRRREDRQRLPVEPGNRGPGHDGAARAHRSGHGRSLWRSWTPRGSRK